MVLCPGCKRHIFAKETSCPFCGLAVTALPTAQAAPRALPSDLSRAERYAIGAAMAVSVATAGCSSPTVVHNPDEIRTVDVNAGPSGDGTAGGTGVSNGSTSSGGSNNQLEVAGDPDPNDNQVVAQDADEEARRREELLRKKRELQQQQQLEEQRRWQEERWRNRPPCGPNGACPPYGCVFPDEACDVVRA